MVGMDALDVFGVTLEIRLIRLCREVCMFWTLLFGTFVRGIVWIWVGSEVEEG